MSRLTKKIMIPDSLNTVFHRPLATDKTLLAKRQKQKLLLFSVEWIIMIIIIMLWNEGTQIG